MKLATARLLVGRKIVAFDARPFDDGRGGTAHDPCITLDNGAVLVFSVQELEHAAGYGVEPLYHRPNRKPGTRQ